MISVNYLLVHGLGRHAAKYPKEMHCSRSMDCTYSGRR